MTALIISISTITIMLTLWDVSAAIRELTEVIRAKGSQPKHQQQQPFNPE